MVTEAVDAYVDQDLELARKVMAHDDVVDDYFAQIKNSIIDIIAEWVDFFIPGVHKDCR